MLHKVNLSVSPAKAHLSTIDSTADPPTDHPPRCLRRHNPRHIDLPPIHPSHHLHHRRLHRPRRILPPNKRPRLHPRTRRPQNRLHHLLDRSFQPNRPGLREQSLGVLLSHVPGGGMSPGNLGCSVPQPQSGCRRSGHVSADGLGESDEECVCVLQRPVGAVEGLVPHAAGLSSEWSYFGVGMILLLE